MQVYTGSFLLSFIFPLYFRCWWKSLYLYICTLKMFLHLACKYDGEWGDCDPFKMIKIKEERLVTGGSECQVDLQQNQKSFFWPSDFYAGKEKYHKAMFKSRFPSRYLMVVEHWQWHDIKFHEYSRKRKLEYLNRHNLVVEGAQTLCGRTSEAEKHDRRPSQVHVSSHITHSKFSYKPFLKVHWPDPRARTVPLQCLQRPQETVDGCENQQSLF